MNAARILYTAEHRLRAPWRILLFIIVLAVTLILAAWIESVVDDVIVRRGYTPLISDWSIPIGVLAATAVMLRWVDGLPWSSVGLDRKAAVPRTLASGSLMGLLPIAVPSALLLAAGQLEVVASAPGNWWAAAVTSFGNLFPAAFGEELLMRGYLFTVLRVTIGWKWTLVSTSVVFGLLHVANPGSDPQNIAMVTLAGFFLGAVLLATRSLWAATMAHFVWNWFMAAGLHSPVSGLPVATPHYQVVDSGPDWLTGGAWGPEGGLAAALGMLALLIYLHSRHLRRMESWNG